MGPGWSAGVERQDWCGGFVEIGDDRVGLRKLGGNGAMVVAAIRRSPAAAREAQRAAEGLIAAQM